MATTEIAELQRLFTTRLDTLSHILAVGAKHVDLEAALKDARLAPDMFPLGAQIAFACNQPRGFSQWCAGEAIDNLGREIDTVAQAQAILVDTKARVAAIAATDAKLDEIKRVGLGPGKYCELPARRYVSEYLLPNLYFHMTTTYSILRHLGVPLGKADFMAFLAPHVRSEG